MNLPDGLSRAIEAILFAAGYPVTYEKLASVLEVGVREIKKATEAMLPAYEDRGIQLLLFENSCQLCTKEEHEPLIRSALGIKGAGGLSNSCLEVLAIIAYNQPVTRAFIEQVRGSDSSYAMNILTDRHLIEVTGRLSVPGKPMLYSTTEDFLRVFGLGSVEDLPKTELSIPDENEAKTAEIEPETAAPETDNEVRTAAAETPAAEVPAAETPAAETPDQSITAQETAPAEGQTEG